MSEYRMPVPEIPGWMQPEELAWLYAQARQVRSVVEVGTWRGRSAHALAAGCPGRVWCVDHFRGSAAERETTHREAASEDIEAACRANLAGFPHVTILRGESTAVAATFALRSVDLVFIDGGHEYAEVLADLRAWGPVAVRLLCGHDFYKDGVRRAVTEYLAARVLGGAPDRPAEGPGWLWSVRLGGEEDACVRSR